MTSNDAFGARYAKYYDLLYSDKDYEKECDFIEEIFRRFASFKIKSILDISCGTGGHAIPLARRRYAVTAFDSSKHMVQLANDKATKMKVKIDLSVADMRNFSISRKFDACISMFDSIDYLPNYSDLELTFTTVAKHLKPGSLFIFQFWSGPAVLMIRPSPRYKIAAKGDLKVIRYATPYLKPLEQICEVDYHVMVMQNRMVIDEFEEKHLVRFFFPEEIKYILGKSGYDTIGIYPFMNVDRELTDNDWSAITIARLRSTERSSFSHEGA